MISVSVGQCWKGYRGLITWPTRSLLPLLRKSEPPAVLKTYCADEAGVMPGVSQGFDKLVPSLHGEIAAMTLGAEQIDVVWNERQSEDQASRQAGRSILDTLTQCHNNDTTPQITELGQWGGPNWLLLILQTKCSVTWLCFFLFNNLHWWCMDSGLVTTLCWFNLQTLSRSVINFLSTGWFSLLPLSPFRAQTDQSQKRKKKSHFPIAMFSLEEGEPLTFLGVL